MRFLGEGGSETLDHLLRKPCKTRFFESSILKIGYGALHLTITVLGQKMAFLGHKMRFFGDGGPEALNHLLQNLAKHEFLSPAPSKQGMGPYN